MKGKSGQATFLPFVSLVGLGVMFWIFFGFGGSSSEVGLAQQGVFDSIYFVDSGSVFLHSSLRPAMSDALFNFASNGGFYSSSVPLWFYQEVNPNNCGVSPPVESFIDWRGNYREFLDDSIEMYEDYNGYIGVDGVSLSKDVVIEEWGAVNVIEVSGDLNFNLRFRNVDEAHEIVYRKSESFSEVLEHPLPEDFGNVRSLVREKYVLAGVSDRGVDVSSTGLNVETRPVLEGAGGSCSPRYRAGCDTGEDLLFLYETSRVCSSDDDCRVGFCHLGVCVDARESSLEGIKEYETKTFRGDFSENSSVDGFENLEYVFGLRWLYVSEDFTCLPDRPPRGCEDSDDNRELKNFLPSSYSSSDYFCGDLDFVLEEPVLCEDRSIRSKFQWDSCVEEIELYCSRLSNEGRCLEEFSSVTPCEYRERGDSGWGECREQVVAYCTELTEHSSSSDAYSDCFEENYDDPSGSRGGGRTVFRDGAEGFEGFLRDAASSTANFFIDVTENIDNGLNVAWDWFVETGSDIGEGIVNVASAGWNGVTTGLKAAGGFLADAGYAVANGIGNGVKTIFSWFG